MGEHRVAKGAEDEVDRIDERAVEVEEKGPKREWHGQ
jgi:hypothetical protein